ncbi:MAG: hypothetical protein ACI9E1_001074 [Cryomorphaceae bacterium]|jgi:hypothetical protein
MKINLKTVFYSDISCQKYVSCCEMEGFSDHIFWDVDRGSVELLQNAGWLTQRVLEKGYWSY